MTQMRDRVHYDTVKKPIVKTPFTKGRIIRINRIHYDIITYTCKDKTTIFWEKKKILDLVY